MKFVRLYEKLIFFKKAVKASSFFDVWEVYLHFKQPDLVRIIKFTNFETRLSSSILIHLLNRIYRNIKIIF